MYYCNVKVLQRNKATVNNIYELQVLRSELAQEIHTKIIKETAISEN